MSNLKVNWFSAAQLLKIDSTLPVGDFKTIDPFFRVCREHLAALGFVFDTDEVVFLKEINAKGICELRYNCAVVRGVKSDKFTVKELGIEFTHIKKSNMTDLDKLVHVRNNLSVFTDGNGKPQEDSAQALRYLEEYINKMRDLGVNNIKQLLK